MMRDRVEFTTDVGRIVQGSLYKPTYVNMMGEPLIYKTGPNKGEPRPNFWFSLAIKKQGHWNQTSWGKIIFETGQKAFPQGQTKSDQFAWKIIDGDDENPNIINNRRPCDNDGFAGNWILKFSTSFASGIYDTRNNLKQIIETDFVNPGDFIQVYASVSGNGDSKKPGVLLNQIHIAFCGYGDKIITTKDPHLVGFTTTLPEGASLDPIGNKSHIIENNNFNQSELQENKKSPPPYPDILNIPKNKISPPPIPLQKRVMLPAADGNSYAELIEAGWTDELLIQHKMMAV